MTSGGTKRGGGIDRPKVSLEGAKNAKPKMPKWRKMEPLTAKGECQPMLLLVPPPCMTSVSYVKIPQTYSPKCEQTDK